MFYFFIFIKLRPGRMAATLAADIFKDNFVIENRLMK